MSIFWSIYRGWPQLGVLLVIWCPSVCTTLYSDHMATSGQPDALLVTSCSPELLSFCDSSQTHLQIKAYFCFSVVEFVAPFCRTKASSISVLTTYNTSEAAVSQVSPSIKRLPNIITSEVRYRLSTDQNYVRNPMSARLRSALPDRGARLMAPSAPAERRRDEKTATELMTSPSDAG